MEISVQEAPFNLADEINRFTGRQKNMGAIVTFSGIVRNNALGDIQAMDIEYYPGMTESVLGEAANRSIERWSLGDVLIIHRYGQLCPGELIMMIATAAAHRRDAFNAADYLMDFLKSRAPFWKKECKTDRTIWVEAKSKDEVDLKRW